MEKLNQMERLAEWTFVKMIQIYAIYRRHFKFKNTNKFTVKGWEKLLTKQYTKDS